MYLEQAQYFHNSPTQPALVKTAGARPRQIVAATLHIKKAVHARKISVRLAVNLSH